MPCTPSGFVRSSTTRPLGVVGARSGPWPGAEAVAFPPPTIATTKANTAKAALTTLRRPGRRRLTARRMTVLSYELSCPGLVHDIAHEVARDEMDASNSAMPESWRKRGHIWSRSALRAAGAWHHARYAAVGCQPQGWLKYVTASGVTPGWRHTNGSPLPAGSERWSVKVCVVPRGSSRSTRKIGCPRSFWTATVVGLSFSVALSN